MAEVVIILDKYVKFQNVNPVLLKGQFGYEEDFKRLKIGDGVNRYKDLPYFGTTANLSNYYTKSETNALITAINATLAALSSDVLSLQGSVTTIEGNIVTIQQDIADLQSFIGAIVESDPIFTAWQAANDNHANWDTAYSWGNHASAGYLTVEFDPVFQAWLLATPPLYTFTEVDPVFSAWATANDNHANWDTAYGWGNHASANYVPQARTLTINGTTLDLTADRSWTINSMVYPSAGIALSTGSAWGSSITNNSSNWNTAYGWGNHASAGYLTSVALTSGLIGYGVAGVLGSTATFTFDGTNMGIGVAGTSKLHIVRNAIGITQSDAYGILLDNTTAAGVGAQQMSPPIVQGGRGWKTNATAGSQTVYCRQMVVPIQGAANPTATILTDFNINGAGYVTAASIQNTGAFTFGSAGVDAIAWDAVGNLTITGTGSHFPRLVYSNPGYTPILSLGIGGTYYSTLVSTYNSGGNWGIQYFSINTGQSGSGTAHYSQSNAGYISVGTVAQTLLSTFTITGIVYSALGSITTGTTTANASTTITNAANGYFQTWLAVGDRIALSSASSTYATVTSIASDSSLTVDTALGNGTTQSFYVKKALFKVEDSSRAIKFLITDNGVISTKHNNILMGDPATVASSGLLTISSTNSSNVTILALQTGGLNRFTFDSTRGYAQIYGGNTNGSIANQFSLGISAASNVTAEGSVMTTSYGNSFIITGSYATQRFYRIAQPTINAASALSISSYAANFVIDGAVISSGSVTLAKSIGLYITAGTSVAAGATAAYGLYVDSPTGGTANYAAMLTGMVGIGAITAPTYMLHVKSTSNTDVRCGFFEHVAASAGGQNYVALQGAQSSTGTGTYEPIAANTGLFHNTGVSGTSLGTGAGTKMGMYALARTGNIVVGVHGVVDLYNQDSTNYGAAFVVTASRNGASTTEKHIGGAFVAKNGNINVGGFFGLMSAPPTYVSCAGLFDNGAEAVPIAIFRDNGTEKWSIADGGNTTWADAVNMVFNTTTGTKIGTATSQKIGFWNVTPIIQPTTAYAAATLVSNLGTPLTDTDTIDGYTLKQVVAALRGCGLLA